eukprot:1782260-Amphidinium_carterae.1
MANQVVSVVLFIGFSVSTADKSGSLQATRSSSFIWKFTAAKGHKYPAHGKVSCTWKQTTIVHQKGVLCETLCHTTFEDILPQSPIGLSSARTVV